MLLSLYDLYVHVWVSDLILIINKHLMLYIANLNVACFHILEFSFIFQVRYHSRKKLAEQRPRIKGQFVRRIVYGAAWLGSFYIFMLRYASAGLTSVQFFLRSEGKEEKDKQSDNLVPGDNSIDIPQ